MKNESSPQRINKAIVNRVGSKDTVLQARIAFGLALVPLLVLSAVGFGFIMTPETFEPLLCHLHGHTPPPTLKLTMPDGTPVPMMLASYPCGRCKATIERGK